MAKIQLVDTKTELDTVQAQAAELEAQVWLWPKT